MKIACISDTHGRKGWIVPECDVFIHAGDLTAGGGRRESRAFGREMVRLMEAGVARYILICAGNHDRAFEKHWNEIKAAFDHPNIHALVNEGIELEGKKFWLSPYTPPFFNWNYMAEEHDLARMYQAMPKELDVLITHGPPRGILDPGFQAPHVGSTALLDAVSTRDIKHHVFGHLHSAGGLSKPVAFLEGEHGNRSTYFHNVAACNEAYQLVNNCLEFEI